MKFTTKIKVPSREEDVRSAYLEPQKLADRRQLQEITGLHFYKVEAKGYYENLFIKIIDALFKLYAVFCDQPEEAKVIQRDYLEIADSYITYCVIREWQNSESKEEREISRKIQEAVKFKKLEVLVKSGRLERKDRP